MSSSTSPAKASAEVLDEVSSSTSPAKASAEVLDEVSSSTSPEAVGQRRVCTLADAELADRHGRPDDAERIRSAIARRALRGGKRRYSAGQS